MKSNKKIIPKDRIRSIEVIMRDNPNMIAKDILAEQKYDEACFDLCQKNLHKSKIKLINDININGGYYKGRFGLDQLFYYNITNASLQSYLQHYIIVAKVEKIYVFLGGENGVVKLGDVKIEKSTDPCANLSKYGLEIYTRTTKEDFEQVVNYLNDIEKFWNDIK